MDIYSRCVNAREPVEEAVETHFPWCKDESRRPAPPFRRLRRSQGGAERPRLRRPAALLARPAHRASGRPIHPRRFDCVLVDEYQDTNRLQAEILQTALSRRQEPHRGGRRRSGHLLVPCRHRAQHPRLPPAVPRHPRRHPRAELPQHPGHPRHHQRCDRRGGRTAHQEPVVRSDGEAQAAVRLLRRRGPADRVRHPSGARASGGRSCPPPPGRALQSLPSQPGPGDGARPAQHPLPQVRGTALRRDRSRQGPHGLPASGREPAGPHGGHQGADAPARGGSQEGQGSDGPAGRPLPRRTAAARRTAACSRNAVAPAGEPSPLPPRSARIRRLGLSPRPLALEPRASGTDSCRS